MGARFKLPKKQWQRTTIKILAMLIWAFASVAAAQIMVQYLLLFVVGRENLAQPVWSAIYMALSYIITLLLVILVPRGISKKWSSTRESLGLKDFPTWTDLGLAPVGYIAAIFLSTGLTWIFSLFPWFNAGEMQASGFGLYLFGIDRIIAFVALVVIAPIAEEIIFRGWLYGKMREETSSAMKKWGSIILSSVLTSLLFGLVHFQWNVAVDVFCLSMVLCALREITGTIHAGILVHILKNCIAFYLLYVAGVM